MADKTLAELVDEQSESAEAVKTLVDVLLHGLPLSESPYCVHSFIVGRAFESMTRARCQERNRQNVAIFLKKVSEELIARGYPVKKA